MGNSAAPGYDIVVIGASTGGIKALRTILSTLPADLLATVFIVLHIGNSPRALHDTLSKCCSMQFRHARDGQAFTKGQVYVAPADHHMILTRGQIRLNREPKEHFTRPAANPLFRSAATVYGARVIGVVLTGGDSDGAEGMRAITEHGGIGIVQDPAEAAVADMPEHALEGGAPQYCLPEHAIGPLLIRLIQNPVGNSCV